MKKPLIYLLTLTMVLSLTACGGKSQTGTTASKPSTAATNGSASEVSENAHDDILSVVHPDFELSDGFIEPVIRQESAPDGYIELRTVQEFSKISLNPSARYILMADMDLSAADWSRIEEFSGVLDGNGYTVSDAGSELFRTIDGGVVKNLKVTGELTDQSALIAEYARNATVKNCVADGSITSYNRDGNVIGGLLGKVQETYVYSCYSSVDITVCNAYVGGIAGSADRNCMFLNCCNVGDIDNTKTNSNSMEYTAGGIVGEIDLGGSNAYQVSVEYCCNYGSVYGYIASGIVGSWESTDDDSVTTIDKCFNAGEITAETISSGIVCAGWVHDAWLNISNCYNSGDVYSAGICGGSGGKYGAGQWTKCEDYDDHIAIWNCYDVGMVYAAASISYACKNLQYCYYLDEDGNGSATADGALFADVKGMSAGDMSQAENYKGFDFDTVWQIGSGDYPYPVFKETTYLPDDGIG